MSGLRHGNDLGVRLVSRISAARRNEALGKLLDGELITSYQLRRGDRRQVTPGGNDWTLRRHCDGQDEASRVSQ
jgi:hypothetical protein